MIQRTKETNFSHSARTVFPRTIRLISIGFAIALPTFWRKQWLTLSCRTLGGRNSAAMDINDRGEIVGLSQTGEIDPIFGLVTRGFLVRGDGVMRELRSVIIDVR